MDVGTGHESLPVSDGRPGPTGVVCGPLLVGGGGRTTPRAFPRPRLIGPMTCSPDGADGRPDSSPRP